MTSLQTGQTEWTEQELLANHAFAEPLIVGGVRCHGGFDDDGRYVSPRTKNRVPAIEAWERTRREHFGTPQLDIELSAWPENYPNVAQAKYLISEGVTQPIVSILTRVGTVEGFGAFLRYSPIPKLQRCFDEDISGTSMSHLGGGLYEAHARDEAGFEDEGGHKQMWFAARDIAFDHPVTADETERMLARMGIGQPGGGPLAAVAGLKPQEIPEINGELEMLINRMASLLLIEISAFHVFAWAEEVLSDTDLIGGDGLAARLVSYIRQDETPHVEYLKTTLSEMRDHTFVAESGRRIPGTDIIGRLWESNKKDSLGARREQNIRLTLREVELALEQRPDGKDMLERFHSIGSIRPASDGSWKPSATTSY